MRRAELIMALVMATLSVYLMWKSTELPIGWDPDRGPGGGAFPFWLAAGMLLSCIAIIVRWAKRATPFTDPKPGIAPMNKPTAAPKTTSIRFCGSKTIKKPSIKLGRISIF